MNYTDSTAKYIDWLRKQVKPEHELFKQQLAAKEEKMRAGAFAFLRGTFYRWAELWPEHCAELARRQGDREYSSWWRERGVPPRGARRAQCGQPDWLGKAAAVMWDATQQDRKEFLGT